MVVYALVVAAVVAIVGVPRLRSPVLTTVQQMFDRADRRWDSRLRHGEALVAEGRFEEAATYLVNLDSIFPARTVHAGRDRERERLLMALALSYERLGRNGRALDTYRRLTAFDPRNWRSHFALAQAVERLEGGWATPDEAAAAYRAVLAMHPNHLPSVRGLMQYAIDGGRFDEAMMVWDAYLDDVMLQLLYIYAGDAVHEVNVRVDGRPQEVVLPVRMPPGDGHVQIHTGGFSLKVHEAIVVTPQAVGSATPTDTVPLAVLRHWSAGTTDADGVLRADAPASVVTLAAPELPSGATALRLRITAFKPLDRDTWSLAERSYRNLLRLEERDAVTTRLLVHPDRALVDSLDAIPG